MPDLFRGTTALITGASRGIGAAFALQLAGRGANLVLVARHPGPLEELAARVRAQGVAAHVLPADLADASAPAELVRRVDALGLTVDHLINNAGIGVHGRFQDGAADAHLAVIDVNVRALTELAARFLPGMIARRRGGLLNVASTSSLQGLAWLPVYSATKAYVMTWSEATWVGLRGTGVRCCCLSPGPVDTPWFEANRVTAVPPRFTMQAPATVAAAGLRAYERDRPYSISSLPFRVLGWSTRLAPRWLAARIGAFYSRPG